jgi:hypothetical protein
MTFPGGRISIPTVLLISQGFPFISWKKPLLYRLLVLGGILLLLSREDMLDGFI